MLYSNKNALQSSIIIAGWDEKRGPQIYAVPSGGSLIPVEGYYGTGSGMAILRGYLEAHYRNNMSYEEARDLLLNGTRSSRSHLALRQKRQLLRRQHPTQQDLQRRAQGRVRRVQLHSEVGA